MNAEGAILRREVLASDPDLLAKWLAHYCPILIRVVLETGPLSAFLYRGLAARDVWVECICARHAKGMLSARVNKSDVHDAEGLAQLALTGWVQAGSHEGVSDAFRSCRDPHSRSAGGSADLDGQPVARLGSARAPAKLKERLVALYAQRPNLQALFAPLIASMKAIETQLRASDRVLAKRAASDPVCARLMTVPGVGPITALTYTMSIEDPRRFAKSSVWRTRYARVYLEGWRPLQQWGRKLAEAKGLGAPKLQ